MDMATRAINDLLVRTCVDDPLLLCGMWHMVTTVRIWPIQSVYAHGYYDLLTADRTFVH